MSMGGYSSPVQLVILNAIINRKPFVCESNKPITVHPKSFSIISKEIIFQTLGKPKYKNGFFVRSVIGSAGM